MPNIPVDVATITDGTVVVRPHGDVGADSAVALRQALVHAVRRLRPRRLILDLADVLQLDSISLGTVAALCDLAVDQQVTFFIDNPCPAISAQLQAVGVARRQVRRTPTTLAIPA